MRFTDIFIHRPVLATVVSLLILLLGARAAMEMEIRQYPELENTTVTVTTAYPGASSDLIKGFITTPAAGYRRSQRHRLPDIYQFAGRVDH